MVHKFSAGESVYFSPPAMATAARGIYKIVRTLPIENDNKLSYRIKSTTENVERIAEEHQLSPAG